jgi:cell wall-associated NlpC family hydrolase
VPRPFPGAPRPALAAPALPPGEHGPNGFDSYDLVGTALALRGAPYRNGGADPRGFDCSGFTQYVFGQHGVPLARDVREQFQQGASVQPEDISPGDLVFFSTTDPGASHVAIIVGSDQFVHAPSSQGVVRVERLSSSYWSRRYLGARRLN